MPNEIYHRSNWGESKAEGFGDVYYDHAATNKLYNHSDYYENSDGTDATLKDLNNKASIVLTPTAYSDGSLNTVIPPYQVLSELVTNGTFDTDTDWSLNSGVTISGGTMNFTSTAGAYGSQDIGAKNGVKYKITFEITSETSGSLTIFLGAGNNVGVISGLGKKEIIATASTNLDSRLYFGNVFTGSIDNVSVKEIQEADFDFSRGSSATRVNEQGLVEDVQILSGELVQNGDFEQIGSELVTNGDFDDGLNGWSSHSGSILELEDGKAKVTTVGVHGFIKRTDLSIQSGKIYFCKADITNALNPQLYLNGISNVLYPMPLISGNTYGGYVKTTGNNSTFYIRGNNTDGEVSFIDNVSVKEVGQNWTLNDGAFFTANGVNIKHTPSAGILTSDGYTALVVGRKYRMTYEIVENNAGAVKLGSATDEPMVSTVGTHTKEFIADLADVRIIRDGTTVDVTIDNISVVEVTDDTDLPRIDFTDGTGSLLLEPQRTNFVTYSENLSEWVAADITVTDNDSTSPDGSQNASKLELNSGTRIKRILLGSMPTSAVTRAYSVFVKADSDFTGAIQLVHSGDLQGFANFDLSDGTVGSTGSKTTANIVNYSNGWYRCTAIFDSSNTFGSSIYLWMQDDDSSSYGGSTSATGSVFAYGFQYEQGDYATSYIPTSGSTVTRSDDVANNSGNADLFNDSEGVLYAEIAALANDGTDRVITISDGSTSNRVTIYYTTTNNQIGWAIISNNSATAFNTHSINNSLSINKFALKYKQDDFQFWINGEQVGTDTSGATPTGLDELAFYRGGGTLPFYGKTKCVAVFKEALSNDLLERLTGEGYESFRLLAEANNYTII